MADKDRADIIRAGAPYEAPRRPSLAVIVVAPTFATAFLKDTLAIKLRATLSEDPMVVSVPPRDTPRLEDILLKAYPVDSLTSRRHGRAIALASEARMASALS